MSEQLRWRIVAWAAATLGVLILGAGIAESSVVRIAERVADRVRPELTDDGLARHRQDFESANSVLAGLTDDVLPALAESLNVQQDLLMLQRASQYRAVAKLVLEKDEMASAARGSLENLERQQGRFESADSIPASWLPIYASSAWTMVLGAIALAVGLALAFRPKMRGPEALVLLGAAGVLLVALPLAFRLPWKAADADTVLDSLNASEDVVRRTGELYATARDGFAELDERALPDLASALGISRGQLDALIAQRFPEAAAGLAAMPAVLDRYGERVAIRSDVAGDIRTLQDIPMGALAWLSPAFGAILTGLAGWAIVASRRAAAPAAVAAAPPADPES
jgi:hypothetical protein